MSTNEKKGITVKIDAELHAQVREYLEKHEMTMAEFVTLALQDELCPKFNLEGKSMGKQTAPPYRVWQSWADTRDGNIPSAESVPEPHHS